MTSARGVSDAFRSALLASGNEMGFAIVTLLAWIATCDGHLAAEERAMLEGVARRSEQATDATIAIRAAQGATPEELQLACEIVRHLDTRGRRLFMQMALGIAVEDGVLRPIENHVVRFIADVLGFGAEGLREIFGELSGKQFPYPQDLSDPQQWRSAGYEDAKAGTSGREQGKSRSRSSASVTRVQAYAILGLEEGASVTEIKDAYRRLARIHHPDRFSTLGPEAIQAATVTFQRIQRAYQVLTE